MAKEEALLTMEEWEQRYGEVAELYDYASQLADTVESKMVTDNAAQLAIVEPLINEISEAADVLTEEFIHIAESRRSKGKKQQFSKQRIEGALRRVYSAIHDYRSRTQDQAKRAHKAIQNIADPIVEKLQRHVERVVAIFIEFVQLSLQNIMNAVEITQIRARQVQVALALHQLGQQQ